MIGKILNNIYVIKGDFLVYVIEIGNELIIIDSSDGDDTSIILDGLFEIIEKSSQKPTLLIITSYKREVAGGASFLSQVFSIPVATSRDIAPILRQGGSNGDKFQPVNVSFEISRNEIEIMEEKLQIIKSNTPVKGSFFIKYNHIMFTGASRVSGLRNKISYICNAYNFEKVI